jgi:hypothetical protein
VEIPNPALHPAVVAIRIRHVALTDELADVKKKRHAVEHDLGAGPGCSDVELEGRLLAAGEPTEPVGQLRDLRRREQVLAHAIGLVGDEMRDATGKAAREYSATARDKIYLPAAREAVAAWLAAVQVAERFRNTVERLHSTGVGAGTHTPFSSRVPLDWADAEGFAAFARELIGDGFTTADLVNAAVPGAL